MHYTFNDMCRDLIPPVVFCGLFAIFWAIMTAIEAASAGKSFWDCIITCVQ